ncbi:MAG: sugar ABC transporter permease [Anaerolineae bacterium]|jgi:multiple sugar transport system permease protein
MLRTKRKSLSALSGAERREARWSLFFISPWIIGFILLTLIPLATSLSYSFMEFKIAQPEEAHFVGLENYRRLAQDEIAWRSLRLTAAYVFIWTPVSVLAPLGIATLLHSKHLGMPRLFRLLFYLPSLIPEIAVAFITYGFFSGRGWFYQLFLAPFGVPDTSPILRSFYMVFFVSAGLWGVGNVILILLAAKQGVPVDLYEAADVDGAEWLCKYVRITLPMISPVIFYSLVIGLISSFQFFAAPFLVSAGGYDPDHPWMFFTVYMSTQLRVFQDLGYTATLGWLLAAFVGVVTLLVFITSRRWVFYREG